MYQSSSSTVVGPFTPRGGRRAEKPAARLIVALCSGLFFLALLPLGATPASADVLVTQEGQRIETDGPWEVKGRQVIFTTKSGILSSMRVTEVDLEASERATNPPPVAPPPKREVEVPPSLVDLVQRDRPAPVLILTNDDVESSSSKELEALARVFGGAMMEALREIGEQLAQSGAMSEAEKESFDREMQEQERLIQQGYEEAILSLAAVAERYPEFQMLDPANPDSVRQHAVAISSAAKELKVSAHQIQTEPGRILLQAVALQLEALVAGIP